MFIAIRFQDRKTFHHYVTVCDRQRSGQPRVTTPAQYRYIHPLHPAVPVFTALLTVQ